MFLILIKMNYIIKLKKLIALFFLKGSSILRYLITERMYYQINYISPHESRVEKIKLSIIIIISNPF